MGMPAPSTIPDNWVIVHNEWNDEEGYGGCAGQGWAICPQCGYKDDHVGQTDCYECGWMVKSWRDYVNACNGIAEAHIHDQNRQAIESQYADDPGKARIELDQLEYERRWDASSK